MLRSLYRLMLRAHPPYFRQRFADEMLSIFDHAGNKLSAIGLLADAMISLARQWVFRGHYQEEPALAVAADGSNLFESLRSPTPRTAALVKGALLSALVLNGVGLTMGYAWNHPIYIPLRRPVIVPPASWGAQPRPPQAGVSRPVEPNLYTEEGRVLLVFKAPAHSRAPAPATAPPISESPRTDFSSAGSNLRVSFPANVLQSYAGTYVNPVSERTRVNITVEGGRLQLEVVGEFRSVLAPLPRPQLLTCATGDCWVAFSTSPNGSVDRIVVHQGGREIVALRH